MSAKTQQKQRSPSHPIYFNEGLTPKKTALIIVTVIGCIAILWPKVFYPMMFGSSVSKTNVKEERVPGGCCDVVLDREQFMNASMTVEIGPQLYRKNLNLYTGEISIRQERPAHLHPESIYQAMRERGRAIPANPTVPIVERKISPSNPPPRIVEGRPGPIPGMRPPMGAGAIHQPQSKSGSMGFLLPLYTIGIILFFGYTIMKIVFKKPLPNAPYGPVPVDSNFKKDVFGDTASRHVEDLNGSKLVVTAIQGLIDAADEQLKLRDKNTTCDLFKKPNDSTSNNVENISNGHTKSNEHGDNSDIALPADKHKSNENEHNQKQKDGQQQRKRRNDSAEREVTVLGMEITASCEGGQKWSGRPPTPVFVSQSSHSKIYDDDMPEPQSIYLEGALGHESQILVADSETKTENVYNGDFNGTSEEPAVVLSSKMTLSLINLNVNQPDDDINKIDVESPLADDIEIIGLDEN